MPQQFANAANPAIHKATTAEEIWADTDGQVDILISGVGTGGTLVGLYLGCAEVGCHTIPVHARPFNLYPAGDVESCTFSARIPGVVDRISEIFDEDRLPGLMTVEVCDEDAIATTRQLMRLGFPVGPSSGLNYRAAVETLKRLDDPSAQVVTVFPDRMERYFTTELFTPFADG